MQNSSHIEFSTREKTTYDHACLLERGSLKVGEGYTVFPVNGFPVGVFNCYEAEFPELARILALKGAQLVVIPTAADESTLLSTGKWTDTPYSDVSKTLSNQHNEQLLKQT